MKRYYVVNTIYFHEEVLFSLNIDLCDYKKFCNPYLKHIITGDLRILEKKKAWKILTKGLNYKEPKSINFRKAYFDINHTLEACIGQMSSKSN